LKSSDKADFQFKMPKYKGRAYEFEKPAARQRRPNSESQPSGNGDSEDDDLIARSSQSSKKQKTRGIMKIP